MGFLVILGKFRRKGSSKASSDHRDGQDSGQVIEAESRYRSNEVESLNLRREVACKKHKSQPETSIGGKSSSADYNFWQALRQLIVLSLAHN